MGFVDDVVKQWMQQVEQSGEMNSIHGKRLDLDDGYLATPEALRMTYKVLKNAGLAPPGVEKLHLLAALREQAVRTSDAAEQAALQQRISEVEQAVRMMLEQMGPPS